MTERPAGSRPHVLVVGGGITGLATAEALLRPGDVDVTVREASGRLGGKIRSSTFAGLDGIDEGPDAFLIRVPHAVDLATRVGLADALTSPTDAHAAVWVDRLHDIPGGIVLGVPTDVGPFARTGLLTWPAKLRAAVEPLLPRTSTDEDALGPFIRRRFGDQVHERLVDALVGSIYAADTDRMSLASVPQLAHLASSSRSVLLGARRMRAAAPSATGPIFAAPIAGIEALVAATARAVEAAGGALRTSSPVTTIEADGDRWRVDDERYDAVVLASPARATAPLLAGAAPDASGLMARSEHADVIMVTMAVSGDTWPDRLRGRSGYLVPKPVQRTVTAASFGSQKWAHWRPGDGRQIIRVSLGRDGLPVDSIDDEQAATIAVDEVGEHLDLTLDPSEIRVTRWAEAFPQYRPHHHVWVAALEASLPAGLHVAGASYGGIGIPACIRQADDVATRIVAGLAR